MIGSSSSRDHVAGIVATHERQSTDAKVALQGRFAAGVSGFPDIEFRNMSVYDVAQLGERFDLVIFMGVLYHLRHPLLALDILHDSVVAIPRTGGFRIEAASRGCCARPDS